MHIAMNALKPLNLLANNFIKLKQIEPMIQPHKATQYGALPWVIAWFIIQNYSHTLEIIWSKPLAETYGMRFA